MASNIRIVEVPDDFGGFRYQLAKMTYDDEGYLSDVEVIQEFETYASLLNFTDLVYKASLHSIVFYDTETGTYDL